MLKVRLIPCIVTKNDLVVQSFGFKKYLPIGNVKTAIEFFVNWDVDEIIIIDIDASKEKRSPNFELVSWAANECFVPLTVGGGIKTIKDIHGLLNAGADKVSLNTIALDDVDFVNEAARLYGDQCITVSVDVIATDSGYSVYDHRTGRCADIDLKTYLTCLESAGAGELLLNSVDRDGSRLGYDLKLLQIVSSATSLPIIALGGVGRFEHLSKAVTEGGCQAVAAANIFQHLEHSTIAAKSQMRRDGLNVRLSSEVKYEDFELDLIGRPF